MEKEKLYTLDVCPHCGGDLYEAGETRMHHPIVKCTKCKKIILVSDIAKLRRKNEHLS